MKTTSRRGHTVALKVPIEAVFSKNFQQPTNKFIRMTCELYEVEFESHRLGTFSNWTNDAVDPRDLAREGFFSTHQLDYVRCAFCFKFFSQWKENDNIQEEHRKWSPDCPFVKDCTTTTNRPLLGLKMGVETGSATIERPGGILFWNKNACTVCFLF